MTKRRRSVLNLISAVLGQILGIAIGFLLPWLFITSFGSEINGLLSSANQILVYLALFEAGVGAVSLQALYGYQHPDGGWGWWKEDATNPFLTGYVISGLVRCREAGWSIDEAVLERGVKSAREQLEGSGSLEIRAYLAWALALAGQAPVETLTALYPEPKLSTYGRALVALARRDPRIVSSYGDFPPGEVGEVFGKECPARILSLIHI